MMERAIFLDRDGTLAHPYHYPSRPEHLRLYDNISQGLRQLSASGFKLVVITNQSGIARGYFTEADLAEMHAHLASELARQEVTLAGIYYCPHHVDGVIPELARVCDCRKPQPGMLLRAARDLGIDVAQSWMVGDILDDVEAGKRAGCRTVLVDVGTEALPTSEQRWPDYVARDTAHALEIIAGAEGLAAQPEVGYRPERWSDMAASTSEQRKQNVSSNAGSWL